MEKNRTYQTPAVEIFDAAGGQVICASGSQLDPFEGHDWGGGMTF